MTLEIGVNLLVLACAALACLLVITAVALCCLHNICLHLGHAWIDRKVATQDTQKEETTATKTP